MCAAARVDHASACVRNGCRGQIRQPVAVALVVGWWGATGSAAGHHSATADVTAIARPSLWCRWRARSARARPSPCGYLCNRTSACCVLRWCASTSATCVPACTQHTAHAMAAWGDFPRCVLVRAAIPCAVAVWNARHIPRAHARAGAACPPGTPLLQSPETVPQRVRIVRSWRITESGGLLLRGSLGVMDLSISCANVCPAVAFIPPF